ncbi:MAG: DUF4350 domain-containing protein [Candidatus Thorarchaeota archaeon]
MGWKEYVQVLLFILAWVPVGMLAGMSVLGVEEVYAQDFSIYNRGVNGTSDFRDAIESAGYEVYSIQSSMGTLSRYGGNATLVIMGPVVDFSVDVILVIFQHLLAGGGVVIADDFGTANNSFFFLNTYLQQMVQLPMNVSGILNFAGGVLYDLDSYDKNPRLPIVRDFTSHDITQGVSELYLNYASAIHPTSLAGLQGVAWTTTRAWCESDIDDPNPWPNATELAGRLPVASAIDLGIGRLVALSDPSMFKNDMIGLGSNLRFGLNIIDWLTGTNHSTVIFCESLLEVPWNSPEFFFGLYLGRALWLSTLPYLAPLFPLVTILGIRKYLPDAKKPQVKSVSEVFLRRGQTYFGERMSYYRTEGNYGRVVKMLYRRLRRDLAKKHQWTEYDARKMWDLIRYKDSSLKEDDFFKTIARIEEISSKPDIKIKEAEMMNLFFWMRNIQSQLIEMK